ncbi:hypothetical protein PV325_006255 [Microctonus aethiopoides]|nr:hypothetical protein PV325_006255 [Microctonus aethiopoides]
MTEERSRIDEYSVRNAILPHSVQFVTVCPHGGDDSQVTHPEVESVEFGDYRTIGRFFGPIDQNLEKIKGTRFSYLSQRNLLKNEKIQFFSTVQTTPYLLQVDFDCEESCKKFPRDFGTALGFAVRPVVASISVIE